MKQLKNIYLSTEIYTKDDISIKNDISNDLSDYLSSDIPSVNAVKNALNTIDNCKFNVDNKIPFNVYGGLSNEIKRYSDEE